MRLLVCALAGAITLGSTGCAAKAGYESIPVESDPPGADVVVECGAIRLTTVTPGRVLLARCAPDCRVTIRKEGYRARVTSLKRDSAESAWADALALAMVSGGVLITTSLGGGSTREVAGDVIVSGLIPWIVDVASCASCDHEPKSLRVVLRPLRSRASQRSTDDTDSDGVEAPPL